MHEAQAVKRPHAPPPAGRLLQRKCECGRKTAGGVCGDCGRGGTLMRRHAAHARGAADADRAPGVVREVLDSAGRPLDPASRAFFESRFGHDFSRVKVHTDERAAESARAVNALAYTVGRDVVFGAGRFRPDTHAGRLLIAHELTHVVQQSAAGPQERSGHAQGPAREAEADRAAEAVSRGAPVAEVARGPAGAIQRSVEMRDVGKGEGSGFARLPELIVRLNNVSRGLTFSLDGRNLRALARPGGTLSDFDRQMMEFIDAGAVIPLRLTNRHDLLADAQGDFVDQIEGDDWGTGNVDMDDLLASTDLGMQLLLLHILRERLSTADYARRMRSLNPAVPAQGAEFNRAHRAGIDTEARMLRDYFGDPTIRFVYEPGTGQVFRVYTNDRGDRIRQRVRRGVGARSGEDATSVEVLTRDGVLRTAEEYRRMLEDERVRRQVEGERLRGATEHRAGGRSIPAR
jgi:hypothetical protein